MVFVRSAWLVLQYAVRWIQRLHYSACLDLVSILSNLLVQHVLKAVLVATAITVPVVSKIMSLQLKWFATSSANFLVPPVLTPQLCAYLVYTAML